MAEFCFVRINFFFNKEKHNYLIYWKLFIINTNNLLLTILNLLQLNVFYTVQQNVSFQIVNDLSPATYNDELKVMR